MLKKLIESDKQTKVNNSHSWKICVLHGPNLNLLGQREPDIYGTLTLDEINKLLESEGKTLDVEVVSFQSNSEGALIDFIQKSDNLCEGIILNAGAYTHTSIAIRDAISAIKRPVVEVHLTNIYKREAYRSDSFISAVAIGQISGFKHNSYLLALHALVDHLRQPKILKHSN